MNPTAWYVNEKESFEIVLGYLNFSSGDPAVKFLGALNRICTRLEERNTASGTETASGTDSVSPKEKEETADEEKPLRLWCRLGAALWEYLDQVQPHSEVFANDAQVRQALQFGFLFFFPEYRVWHKDLLFHQEDDILFNAFSIGQAFYRILSTKAFESVPPDFFSTLEKSVPEILRSSDLTAFRGEIPEEVRQAVHKVIRQYDDFIGYRPIPVLHSKQKMQPYQHEWLHAVPLYIKGAGVIHGRFRNVVSKALEILQNTDEFLLADAQFNFENLEELTFDPRALDFEHPVNRRLNFHFGSWDPLHITNRGTFDRFVLIQSTVQSILSRVTGPISDEYGIPREELEFEAAAVLAGTLLMGCAVSGWGPGARTSAETFSVLLPKVAKIRDSFYQQLLAQIPESHAERLRDEEKLLHQPFAAARQYFNRRLAKQRAEQYQNVQLARLYAWMGYEEASREMVMKVNVPSARMRCEVDCLLTKAHLAIDRDQVRDAIGYLYQIEKILHEGIECGAFLDPWYILGFDGEYPLSSSVEDSTPDQRVDEMTTLVSSIFSLYSRILKETAAKGLKKEQTELMFRMQAVTEWWDQFGTLDLSEIQSISGAETCESIQIVVSALEAWYEAGTAAGDIAFWRPRVADFNSAKAYTLLIEALLDQKDPIASMALLISWLSQSEIFKLDDGDYSFHPLALRWMEDLWYPATKEQRLLGRKGSQLQDGWEMAKRFVDMVEANADIYGVVPSLELDSDPDGRKTKDPGPKEASDPDGFREEAFGEEEFEEEDLSELFNAAWENITYHDSTDDGIDGSMMDGESLKHSMEDFPLTSEMERISDRLLFIITQARLWKMSAVFSIPYAKEHPDRSEVLQMWSRQAETHMEKLHELIREVRAFQVERPDFSRAIAMMEYEKQIGMKFSLLERLVSTCSELMDAQRLMRIADVENRITETDTWENATRLIIQALICSEPERVKEVWDQTMELLVKEPILYEPIDRGGDPIRMIQIRNVLTVIQRLLMNLPLQGLLAETYRMLKVVQEMERQNPVGGARAITRYDHLFDLGSKGILRSVLRSGNQQGRAKWKTRQLIPLLDNVLDILMQNWLTHSHGIRISSLDPYLESREWKLLQKFIQEYGEDLFSPVQMNYSNLQAIHHEGIRAWLEALKENCELRENSIQMEEETIQGKKLLEALEEGRVQQFYAERSLDTIIETLLERYGQFIDYNTTTTQSDNGQNLYMLFDFLRLLAEYDRMAWDLRPFINAHRVMVREKSYEVADSWFSEIQKRTAYHAKQFIRRYKKLCLKYGLAIKTIGDRLDERLVKPMTINKLCALLEPAIQEMRTGQKTDSFTKFLELVQDFTAEPSGTGYEPPTWLEEIENEISRYRNRSEEDDEMLDLKDFIPQILLDQKQLQIITREIQLEEKNSDQLEEEEYSDMVLDLLEHFSDDEVETILNGDLSDLEIETFWRNLQELEAAAEEEEEDEEETSSSEKSSSKGSSRTKRSRNASNQDPDDDEFKKLFE